MAVPGLAGRGDLAGGDLQGGEQGRGAVPDVVVGARSSDAGCIGSIGAVRSSAWIWDFSSTHNTIAFSGGSRYSPTTSMTLATSSGSVENLNDLARHGCTPYSRQPWRLRGSEIPRWRASSRDDQCVTPYFFGGGVNVAAITFARSIVAGPPGPFAHPAKPGQTLLW